MAAFVFAVLAITLLIISAYSYLAAQKVQEDYNKMVSESLHRLELITKLHRNEDLVYSLVIKYMKTSDKHEMEEAKQQIRQLNNIIQTDLKELEKLLYIPSRRQLLHTYQTNRQPYASMLQEVLSAGQQQQSGAANNIADQKLLLAYKQHQLYLNRLGDTISINTRKRSTIALTTIHNTIRNYNVLLLIALLMTGVAAYLIREVLKQMSFNDVLLKSEKRERQQLEHALTESQLIYTSLFRNIAIPIWVFDVNTLKILEVNKAAMQEYGYSRQEFLNLTIAQLQPAEQVAKLKELIPLINDNYSFSFNENWLHVRKDGSAFYVDIKSHSLPPQGNIKPRVVVAINIDEQVKAIQKLERRERQLLGVSSSIPGAVYQFQLDKDMDFSFPFISGSLLNMYGVTPNDIYQDPNLLFKAAHPDELEAIWESIYESARTLSPWMKELRMWSPGDNKWIWIRGHSLPTPKDDGSILYNGTLIDITTQKEAQHQLLESEANLTALLDSSPQAIYLLDKDLKVISFNKVAAEEVSRLQIKQLQTGQSMLNYAATEQLDSLIKDHQQALQGNTVTYDTGCGSHWFEVSYRPVFTQSKDTIAVALSIHDISEQRNIVKAIKENESQLLRSQELAKAGSWEYEIDRNVMKFSQNMYRIYELPEEFRPTFNNILDLFHPEDKDISLEAYYRVIETKTTTDLEHRVLLPNGTLKYLYHIMEPVTDMEGKVIKVVGTTQDITEQKDRELEITETKNRFQSTIENIPEIILSADTNIRIFYISPQCYELTGYTEDEFLASNLWPEIIHKDDLELLESRLLNEGLAGYRLKHECRIITKSGETRWVMLRMSPKLNAEGKVIRLDSSVADITESKLAEEKKTQLAEKLQIQNQNLQQFAYIVSHNLRAPIANILGLSSIYDSANPQAPINQRVIENMYKSAKLLDNTIRDLNELLSMRSELDDAQEKVFFEDVLKQVNASLTNEIAAAGAVLTCDFEMAPAIVTIKSYLKSILHNLISNALKYRDEAKILNIKLQTFEVDGYICLQVSDNGLGIDLQKEKGKVFGLYKRFHAHVAGKGLGLHLVKTQAELLGGKVAVDSSVGVGTTFSVYFLKNSVVDELNKKSSID
ncbi:PAS domain S-box protein [Pontibacter fetidus]|uniref:PAS domain S-box protein n=1 Tax=Pontibacter fetidus TaxID=2700082 RepID=UPI001F29F7CD|nr:PAS domain S-box protein [Pontibacter fetidus]